MSVMFVFLTSTTVHLTPLFCFARNSAIVSIGSIPAFSARATVIESSSIYVIVVSGSIYDVYVEKIIHCLALVIVNGKWHARLNHYDYAGPRELLRKGSDFRAVGEVYTDDGVFSLRVKQIV